MNETKYYGHLKTYRLGAISASSKAVVDISEDDIEKFKYFNVVDITNNSTEDIAVYLDDNTDREIRVLDGTSKAMTGTFFQRLTIENLDSANGIDSGEIIVTVQKEMGFREHVEELAEALRSDR
jgi:hypothetical protein